ncbi:MAG: VWA domain-containing protein [Deltaproteobacteria bacterium]|nr:VWA domain-containing protein [Deltaproteobacteria bacterium]MCB2186348.1 VWA domain-containing protein [Deltaproteobacteria bacterium]
MPWSSPHRPAVAVLITVCLWWGAGLLPGFTPPVSADPPPGGGTLSQLEQQVAQEPNPEKREKLNGLLRMLKGDNVKTNIARNLLLVKEGQITPQEFYKRLANDGGRMFDVMAVKKAMSNAGGDVVLGYFLGQRYSQGGSQVEATLLTWRRKVVMDLITKVIAKNRMSNPDFRMFYSPVGSWPGESMEAMKFAGDIDFSWVCGDPALPWQFKQDFDVELRDFFRGLTGRADLDFGPIDFDTVATAHGKATPDVYISQHGKIYGDQSMMNANMEEIDLAQGQLKPGTVKGEDALKIVAVEGKLKAAKLPDTGVFKQHTEPGLSMEMARHLDHDIIRPNLFDPIDSFLKASKYVERSNAALFGDLGLPPADPALADFVNEMLKLKKASPAEQAKAIEKFFGSLDLFGTKLIPGAFGPNKLQIFFNEQIISRFWKRCITTIWNNAAKGLEFKMKTLNDQIRDLDSLTPDAKVAKAVEIYAQMAYLEKMLLEEMVELEKGGHGTDVPGAIRQLIKDLQLDFKAFKKKFGPLIVGQEGLKDLEYVKQSVEGGAKNSVEMAVSFLARRSMDLMEMGAEGAMKVNAMLDLLDDTIMGELRGDKDFSEFMTMAKNQAFMSPDGKKILGPNPGTVTKIRFQANRVVATVELKLNNLILNNCVSRKLRDVNMGANKIIMATSAGRGAVKAMVAFNLYNESLAYRDAWNKGGWNELATEFFRRRVPFGSAVENAIMGNVGLALWDVTTTLLPPLALGQAAVTLCGQALTWGNKLYYSTELTLFIDNLYEHAVFQLTEVKNVENFKLGVWRLVEIKNTDPPVNVKAFVKKSREAIKEWEKALEQGQDKREYPLTEWGISGNWDERWLLKKNLEETDPILMMIAEMMKEPLVGDRLKSHYKDTYEARWQRVKLAFMLKTIADLEDRRAAEQALYAGMMTEMYAKLMEIAGKLEITDAISKNMDKEVDTSYMTRFFEWMRDMKRDYYSQGSIEDSYERAAKVVKRYLEVYSAILQSRTDAEDAFALGQPVEDGLRILTGAMFLEGKDTVDGPGHVRWAQLPAKSWAELREELLALKKKCVKDAALDSAYDKEMLDKTVSETVWIALWRHVYSEAQGKALAITSAGYIREGALARDLAEPEKLMEKAKNHHREHFEKKKKLLADYEAHWCQVAGLTVLVKRIVDGKKTEDPVPGAQVSATGPESKQFVLEEREAGKYVLPEAPVGTYQIKAKAKDHKSEGGQDEATAAAEIKAGPDGKIVPVTVTIYLVAQGAPKLTVEFTPATESEPPILKFSLTTEGEPLDPATLKLAWNNEDLALTVTPGADGKSLTASHRLTKPGPLGPQKVTGSVADVKKAAFPLTGDFTYTLPLVVEGVGVDDTGGAPADGRATAGEKLKLALKVKNLEPWPRGAATLALTAEDPRLKALGEKQWKLAPLPGRAATPTDFLPFEVGEVKGASETVTLPLAVTVDGVALPGALDTNLTLYPALALVAELVPPADDAKRQGTPNNGDGKPGQGEEVGLTVRVTNQGQDPGPAYELKLTSGSPLLTLAQGSFPGQVLAPGASQDFKAPATVGTAYKTATPVEITAEMIPQGQPTGKVMTLTLTLELAPLDITLAGVKVEDPKSGQLTNVNDGNGKLGGGEYGYLTLTLVNNGPDIAEAYIDLNAPQIGGLTIHKPQSQVGSREMKTGVPVEAKFEIEVPQDYQGGDLPLTITVKDGGSGRSWQTVYNLPIEDKSQFTSKLTLLGAQGPAQPEDINPGATLAYKLEVASSGTAPLTGLTVALEYADVSIVPNQWTAQDFAPGQTREYTGELKIPPTFTGAGFWVRLVVRDDALQKNLHKNKFEFQLGQLATTTTLTPTPPAAGAKEWQLAVAVKDAKGQPVTEGVVKMTATQGTLSTDRVELAAGPGQLTWTPPDQLSGQADIEAAYQGDVEDPSLPDRKYQPSAAKIQLPPGAEPTKVVVKATPTQRKGEFSLQVRVESQSGAPVNKGVMDITASLGKFSGAGLGDSGGQVKITGQELVLRWQAPDDEQAKGTATFAYSGDQVDPAQTDTEFGPSQATLDLPPSSLITPNLTIDPSLIDKDKKIWRLEVKLTDENNRPIAPAQVKFTATGGSFGAGGAVLEAVVDLTGGKYEKGWRQTDDTEQTITVAYPGDQKGPGQTNLRYGEATASLKLPPEQLARSTVFVVDASGSMRGGKLTSAKAAVRGALASYAGGQNQEEWALYVFFGCGSISLMQPFTTNPGDITSKLDFNAAGSTPLIAAMGTAAAYARRAARGKTARIIMLTDGGENCNKNQDPVEAAKGIRRIVREVTPAGGRP